MGAAWSLRRIYDSTATTRASEGVESTTTYINPINFDNYGDQLIKSMFKINAISGFVFPHPLLIICFLSACSPPSFGCCALGKAVLRQEECHLPSSYKVTRNNTKWPVANQVRGYFKGGGGVYYFVLSLTSISVTVVYYALKPCGFSCFGEPCSLLHSTVL